MNQSYPRECVKCGEPEITECRCPCHKAPGCYKMPCSFCGHDHDKGHIVGGIVYGYWTDDKPVTKK